MSLQLDGVSIAPRNGQPLFAPVTLDIAPGEVVTLMGPSGIGKSSLIDLIGGHLAQGFVAQGRILLDGRDLSGVPAEARGVGILFQDPALFPHLSVAGNLGFGLAPGIKGRAARSQAINEALARAGLAGFGARDPETLSGGQKARVALMRTLLAAPRALLLDEPFSRLDPALRDDVRDFTFAHARAQAVPVLLVTHDPGDAQAAGGRIVTLGPLSPAPG